MGCQYLDIVKTADFAIIVILGCWPDVPYTRQSQLLEQQTQDHHEGDTEAVADAQGRKALLKNLNGSGL